jgi:hypothetical protein
VAATVCAIIRPSSGVQIMHWGFSSVLRIVAICAVETVQRS